MTTGDVRARWGRYSLSMTILFEHDDFVCCWERWTIILLRMMILSTIALCSSWRCLLDNGVFINIILSCLECHTKLRQALSEKEDHKPKNKYHVHKRSLFFLQTIDTDGNKLVFQSTYADWKIFFSIFLK